MTIIDTIEKKSNELLDNLKVYVTAPYQTKKDLEVCQNIETELSDIIGLTCSSSRLLDKKLRSLLVGIENEEKIQRLYANNQLEVTQKILASTVVIAVINDNDNDPYRWLDIGIARTLSKIIILFTNNKNILEGQFNFPMCIVNDYTILANIITKINDIFNKTPFIERVGNEIRFYPVSDELKLTINHAINDILEK
jgi:hypothetical protein